VGNQRSSSIKRAHGRGSVVAFLDLKQRQTTIFRQGGDPSAIPQERPGLFVPRGGNRIIAIDSSALLQAAARRRIPVHQRGRISSSAKPRYFARAATRRRFHKNGQACSFLGGVIGQLRSTPALSCELQRVTADPTISAVESQAAPNHDISPGGRPVVASARTTRPVRSARW
jgi:hypothetical protein